MEIREKITFPLLFLKYFQLNMINVHIKWKYQYLIWVIKVYYSGHEFKVV